jgi:ABC-type cobalamin/Fe3+-siderophores transport system ATPase subunit
MEVKMKVFSKLNLLFILILFSFLLISCNANSRYSVGDIVLDDGTVLAPSDFDAYKGNSKPMAVIFSTSGGHEEKSSRVLGVGLNPSEPLKFTPKTSKGYITNILANQTIVVAQEYNIAEGQYNNGGFFGLIDGRKAWKNIGLYDDNAKKSFADYPAYDYAVNYGINNNLKKYKNGWYLPTACEAYELAENLEKVGLTKDHLECKPQMLSSGEMKRMDIARALTAKPDILLLDEPFAHIDFDTRLNVMKVISDYLAEHATILVVVTHEDFDLRYFIEKNYDFPELVGMYAIEK